MSRIDLHVHTNKSDGSGSVAEVLAAAASKPELLAIAITDHNEIAGALDAQKKSKKFGVPVIVGEEVSTSAGHIIGIFLSSKIEKGKTPEETIREIHRQGGLVIIPHPLPHYRGIGIGVLERLVQNTDPDLRPDGIEVRNGLPMQLAFHHEIRRRNLKNWQLAEVGGSDSHHPDSVGSCWTEFDGNSVEDFVKALQEKKTWSAGSGWGILETARALTVDASRRLKARFHD